MVLVANASVEITDISEHQLVQVQMNEIIPHVSSRSLDGTTTNGGPIVTKRKGYEKYLPITNSNYVPAISPIYILPFGHCYNTLVLLS
jgi:hypothetical protein